MGDGVQPDVSERLAALLARAADLEGRVNQVDDQQREAGESLERARDVVADLETRVALGEPVSTQRREKAEGALRESQDAAAAPWPERRRGAQTAARVARQEAMVFAGGNIDALLGELQVEAEGAAAEVDAAARRLLVAYEVRDGVEARTFALLALIGPTRPGDVSRSRADQLVGEAHRLLDTGGEVPPVVTRRPGIERIPEASSA